MFGTLVIQLPSNYTGGKLIVYHQGKKSEFDYGGLDCCSNCYFMSFYADCQHEVEKVTKGYRLCLIYNLMYRGLDECPAPADNQKQVSAIVSAMKEWGEDIESEDCPYMMTYLLEHKYCEASLSFKFLKNGDRAVADVLAQAKAEVDFDLYVGNVSIKELWSAEYSGYVEVNAGDFIEEDICAEHLKASDSKHAISHINLYRDSFVPEDFFDTIDPDQENLDDEDAMGNGGATIDKQYNWAVLLLWPIENRTDVVGTSNMVRLFKQDVRAEKGGLANDAHDILRMARHEGLSFESSLSFLRALIEIGDSKSIAELLDIIAGIGSYDFIGDATFYSLIMSIGRRHGCNILKSPLQTMFGTCSSNNVEKYCTFLKKMITSKKLGNGKDLCKSLLTTIVKFLADEQDAIPISVSTPYSSNYNGYKSCAVHRSKEFVGQLFSLLTGVDSNDLFTSTISALRSKPVHYPVLETLGPAVVDFYKTAEVKNEGSIQEILTCCISQLEIAVHKVIETPTTSARSVKFTCSCIDCVELIRFLKHPTETQHQFKMNVSRRQHLHQQLDSGRADVTHKTEVTGTPHTLIVTKTNASYENNLKKRQQEKALLASLQSLLLVKDLPSVGVEPPAKRQKASDNSTAAATSLQNVASQQAYVDLT